ARLSPAAWPYALLLPHLTADPFPTATERRSQTRTDPLHTVPHAEESGKSDMRRNMARMMSR
ncbi:MAG: hypothetical protein ACRDK7_03885, partial [Solirubrobacteraceae bacterium]